MEEIVIKVNEKNPFLVKKIKNNLQELANVNPDVLGKLAIMSKNEKAIAMFLDNYELIKDM